MTNVTFQPTKFLKGYPAPDADRGAVVVPLVAALNDRFATDAHVQACTPPGCPPGPAWRWTKACIGRPELGGGLAISSLWLDVDAPAHATPTPEWLQSTFEAVRTLLAVHGGCAYQTSHGFRVVFALPSPFPILSPADDAAWQAQHAGFVAYLAETFGVKVDPLSDVTREYRLPKVVRDGVAQPGQLLWQGAVVDALPPDADLTWRGTLPPLVAQPERATPAPAGSTATLDWDGLMSAVVPALQQYPSGSTPNRNQVGLALANIAVGSDVPEPAAVDGIARCFPTYAGSVGSWVASSYARGADAAGFGWGTVFDALHQIPGFDPSTVDRFRPRVEYAPPSAWAERLPDLIRSRDLLGPESVGELVRMLGTDPIAYERFMVQLAGTHQWSAKEVQRLERCVRQAREAAVPKPPPPSPHALIAFDSRVWVQTPDGRDYHAPVARKNLITRLNNLGRADVVVESSLEKTWHDRVRLATECVRDFGQREVARWVDPETITTGCILPQIEPVFDAGVDAWLRAMFGPGYDAAAQWIAVCVPEWAQQLSAALVIVGPTSTGKSFFFQCMAWLWGASGFVPLRNVVADFNAVAEECPVWVDDEGAAISAGLITPTDFLSLMQARAHSVQRKGQERTQLRGAARIGIPVNTLEQFAFGKTQGVNAAEAMAGRLSMHVVDSRADVALAALAALRLPGTDAVDVGRVMRHLRWVQVSTPVVPVRFVGAWGGADARTVALGSVRARQPEAWDALHAALNPGPGSVPPVWLYWARRDGTIVVHPNGLLNELQGCARKVTLRDVHEFLGALCAPEDRNVTARLESGERWRGWRLSPKYADVLIEPVTGAVECAQ